MTSVLQLSLWCPEGLSEVDAVSLQQHWVKPFSPAQPVGKHLGCELGTHAWGWEGESSGELLVQECLLILNPDDSSLNTSVFSYFLV